MTGTYVSVAGSHKFDITVYGKGTVVAALPFIPTIPGTDTYTDMLWADQRSGSETDGTPTKKGRTS